MKTHIWLTGSILQLFCITYLLSGCDEHAGPATVPVPPSLQVVFAPATQEPPNVTRLRVMVEGSQRDVPSQAFHVEAGTTEIDLDLVVPIDATRIRIEAFEAGSSEPAFAGESSAVFNETLSTITIQLDPTTTLLKFNPAQSEIHVEEAFDLEIELKRAENLFAVTFELAFDETLLEVTEVRSGDFWEGSTLIIADHNFAERTPGRLNIGITRVGTSEGLSTSGIIAVIRFRARQSGEGRIQLLNNNKLSLQQPDGSPVHGFADLIRFLSRAETSVLIES
ncbi:MAG: cohesin domain-containing protein [Candidatus Poribacteria bacterium]|nr:cohesin domain-containing protein [Candidatus Poribacteria bacterium]